MLHLPFALGALWYNVKVKWGSIWEQVLVLSIHNHSIRWDTHRLDITSQGGAVVIKILHLDGYGAGGCFVRFCVEKTEIRTGQLGFHLRPC